jgi:hypothetical protein
MVLFMISVETVAAEAVAAVVVEAEAAVEALVGADKFTDTMSLAYRQTSTADLYPPSTRHRVQAYPHKPSPVLVRCSPT